MKKHNLTTTRRVLKRIRASDETMLPTLEQMRFVRFVRDTKSVDDKFHADFAWAVYISHDPCHDSGRSKADRNTVIALHTLNGTFKIIGRELDLKYASKLASGEI